MCLAHPQLHLQLSTRALARSVRALAQHGHHEPLAGSHPSRRWQSSARHHTAVLTWLQLHKAAVLAKLSGLCYVPASDLPQLVKAAGLELMAHGRTSYTSWYVAEGDLDHRPLHAAACRQLKSVVEAPQHHTAHASSIKATSKASHQHPHPHQQSQHTSRVLQPPSPQKYRFVFIRGVHWSAPDAHMSTITSALMNVWPSPFPPPANPNAKSDSSIVSHTGITLLATDLYQQLLPWITAPPAQPAATGNTSPAHPPPSTPLPICIAGHSLGGALGSLVLARCVLEGHCEPTHITCHAFGSPPVLAHRDGGGGHRVLQALGLPDTALQSFVLEHDPVPRAMITTDPVFNTLKQYAPVRNLLEARTWLVGAQQGAADMAASLLRLVSPSREAAPAQAPVVPALSAYRFLFENVGQVYLIKGGAHVVPVGGVAQVDEMFNMAVMDFLRQPARALQAWLDHHHASYAYDLEAAALATLKQQMRAAGR